jgi:hypothetical protein
MFGLCCCCAMAGEHVTAATRAIARKMLPFTLFMAFSGNSVAIWILPQVNDVGQ